MTDLQLEFQAEAEWPSETRIPRPGRRKTPVVPTVPGTYQPLNSVSIDEDDSVLIERMLAFYPRSEPRLILDATVNSGRFWRDSQRRVIGLDIETRHRPSDCADNTSMPFSDSAFDVIVYDPPHIPNQGRDKLKDFNTRLGLGGRSAKENGYSFAHTYPAFVRERGVYYPLKGFFCAKSRIMSTITVTNGLI